MKIFIIDIANKPTFYLFLNSNLMLEFLSFRRAVATFDVNRINRR
jgi:hypothetical protein